MLLPLCSCCSLNHTSTDVCRHIFTSPHINRGDDHESMTVLLAPDVSLYRPRMNWCCFHPWHPPLHVGNEFCERLAYYGLATNLVTYLTHIMGVDAAAAAVQVG